MHGLVGLAVQAVSQQRDGPLLAFSRFAQQLFGRLAQPFAIILSNRSTQRPIEEAILRPVLVTRLKWHACMR